MSWERGYYYRARKVKGRVIKEYVGPGFVGELAARLDLFRREDEMLRRVMERIEEDGSPVAPQPDQLLSLRGSAS